MKVDLQVLVKRIGMASIVLLPNHDLVNYLVIGTPLIVWKQALVAISALLGVYLLNKHRNRENLRLSKKLANWTLLFSLPPLVFAAVSGGSSAMALVYGYFFYLGGIGALLFGAQLRETGNYDRTLLLIARVGIFASCLVIIDYFTSSLGFLPRQIPVYDEEWAEQSLRRAAGLFGASTLVAPFLLLAIASGMILLIRHRRTNDAARLVFIILLALGAIYLSGSRAGMLTATFIVLVQLVVTLLSIELKLSSLFVAVSALLLVFAVNLDTLGSINLQLLSLAERYRTAFSGDAAGNDLRFLVWQDCIDRISKVGADTLLGMGFGTSSGTFGTAYVPHCESSFFQAILEAGPLGAVIRYLPGLLAIAVVLPLIWRKGARSESTELAILVMWLLAYFALVTTSPTAGAFHNQFSYFMVVGLMCAAPARHKDVLYRSSVSQVNSLG